MSSDHCVLLRYSCLYYLYCLFVGAKGEAHEVLVLHGGGAVHGGVPGPEAVRQSLDLDAHYDEVVQGQSTFPRTIL